MKAAAAAAVASILVMMMVCETAGAGWPAMRLAAELQDTRWGVVFETWYYAHAIGAAQGATGLGNVIKTPSDTAAADDIFIGGVGFMDMNGGVFAVPGRTTKWPKGIYNLTDFPNYITNPSAKNINFGTSVVNVGDVNHDGDDDLLVTTTDFKAPEYAVLVHYTYEGKNWTRWDDFPAGRADVLFSFNYTYTSGQQVATNLTANTGTGFAFVGENNSYLGHCAASIGDINGDGESELLVASKQEVYIIMGKKLHTTAVSYLANTTSEYITVASNEFQVAVPSFHWLKKHPLHGRDFNGDGVDDFVIGTPKQFPVLQGVFFIILGNKTRNWTATGLDMNSVKPTTVVALNRSVDGDGLGTTAGIIGDINGDGLADAAAIAVQGGYAVVVFGCRTPPSTIDISSLNGTNGVLFNFQNTSYGTVATADINGDDLLDVWFGMAAYDGETSVGSVFVVFGHKGRWKSPIELTTTSMDGVNGFMVMGQFTAPGEHCHLGSGITSGGDFNGDSVEDVLIGSSNGGFKNGGQLLVMYGNRVPTLTNTLILLTAGATVVITKWDIKIDDNGWVEDHTITTTNVKHGKFVMNGTTITKFSRVELIAGQISFVHDGSESLPSYSASVHDGMLNSETVSMELTWQPQTVSFVLSLAVKSAGGRRSVVAFGNTTFDFGALGKAMSEALQMSPSVIQVVVTEQTEQTVTVVVTVPDVMVAGVSVEQTMSEMTNKGLPSFSVISVRKISDASPATTATFITWPLLLLIILGLFLF